VDTKYRANDGRIVGTAVHLMFERDLSTAIKYYRSVYGYTSVYHEAEIHKFKIIDKWVNDFKKDLTNPLHEVNFSVGDWTGTADLIDNNKLYDYKYSNNVDSYLATPQLHLYAYFLRQMGYIINEMYFVFIPKTFIRRRKDETENEFLDRLDAELGGKGLNIIEVKYDQSKVDEALCVAEDIAMECDFSPKPSKLCDYCEYKEMCKNDIDIVI